MKKIKYMQLGILMLLLSQSAIPVIAQDGAKLDVGADIYSRYVWRGTDFGNAPAIQPWASYSNSGFTIGAWGSYSTNSNSEQEADLFLSYDIGETATLTITDYFFPNGMTTGNNYFQYKEDSTGHVFEGTASYNGTSYFPISLSVSYNFFGADPDNALYFELGYANTLKKVGYNIFVGGGTGDYYLHGENDNNFGIVNMGVSLSREVEISDKFSLPLSGSLILNPTAESIFIVFGFSL
jgi:hypothetical protein